MARTVLGGRLYRELTIAGAELRRVRDRLLRPPASAGTDQWQRVCLNHAVRGYIEALDPRSKNAAEISGSAQSAHPWKSFTTLSHPEFDLCAPLRDRGSFDVVICEQVIEHVPDPFLAARNLRRLCSPGGHVIVSTPFMIRVHELPEFGLKDYWRFTPRGLQALLEQAGLTVSTVGSWGNRRCIAANLDGWPAYRRWQSLRNECSLPMQVWAFARNPE